MPDHRKSDATLVYTVIVALTLNSLEYATTLKLQTGV